METRRECLLIIWKESQLGRRNAHSFLNRLTASCSGKLGLCLVPDDCGALPGRCTSLSGSEAEAEDLAGRYDSFLLPMLPNSLLREISGADTDFPEAAVVVYALCAGKPVYVLNSALGPEPAKAVGNSPLLQALREKRGLVKKLGILTVDEKTFGSAVPTRPTEPRVLVESDILSFAAGGGRKLVLGPNDILTPLAADTAGEKQITIDRR